MLLEIPTEGTCPTGKRRYRDAGVARLALWVCDANPSPRRIEQRTYRCPVCDGWHLTSMGRREEDTMMDGGTTMVDGRTLTLRFHASGAGAVAEAVVRRDSLPALHRLTRIVPLATWIEVHGATGLLAGIGRYTDAWEVEELRPDLDETTRRDLRAAVAALNEEEER